MAAAETLRNFPGDLDLVFSKLSLKPRDVLNVYLIGSRLWGTASASSDYDLYIVVKGNASARNSHFKVPGHEVDAVVVGVQYFEQRTNLGRLKELSCVWAPQSCKLVERQPPRVGTVDTAALRQSLNEGYAKDWARARKLIEGRKLEEGKKVLSHCVRAHDLALQIVQHGKIVDYEGAGADSFDWLRGTYSKQWVTYAEHFEQALANTRNAVASGNGGGGGGSGGGGGGSVKGGIVQSLSVTKDLATAATAAAAAAAADASVSGATTSGAGAAEYWFGDGLPPQHVTVRQVSADADEVAVAELEAALSAATDAVLLQNGGAEAVTDVVSEGTSFADAIFCGGCCGVQCGWCFVFAFGWLGVRVCVISCSVV